MTRELHDVLLQRVSEDFDEQFAVSRAYLLHEKQISFQGTQPGSRTEFSEQFLQPLIDGYVIESFLNMPT